MPAGIQILIQILQSYLLWEASSYFSFNRSEGFALTGYDTPGCMEDGAWMLWENSSAAAVAAVAAVVAAVAAVAHPDFGKWQLLEFDYGISTSGVRGSIRLVFRSTEARISRKVVV